MNVNAPTLLPLTLFVLYWNKPIYIYYLICSTAYARYIHTARLQMKFLQVIYKIFTELDIPIYISMPY